MQKIGWYSADDKNLSDNRLSRFEDSKFALDKKTSVVRELVQNSIDAKVGDCVYVDINVVGIERKKVPCIDELIRRIELCKKKANVDAKREYESAIELLNKPIIYCLKVSDRNTTGVSNDTDEDGNSQYRALVYDEGNSFGKGENSAGSHGVGKRASFILSECNTVFYSTKYKSKDGSDKTLTEGKYMLSTWYEDNQKKCGDGWFGMLNEENVAPIEDASEVGIDEFFVRTDGYGTDVIAIAIDFESKEELYRNLYINSVLENFYVGIIDGKISMNVFGEVIDASTIDSIFDKYYDTKKGAYLAGTNKCLLIGNLYDSKRIYKNITPVKYDIEVLGKKLGYISLYFDKTNEKKKKYYSVVRAHGMKIRDYRLDTEREFTAIVKIEGKELNEALLKLENTAHDDFLTKNTESGVKYDEEATSALKKIKDIVENYIRSNTKIESSNIQKIEGISSILNIPGKVSTVRMVEREVIDETPKFKKIRNMQILKDRDKKLFVDYITQPVIIENDNELIVMFEPAREVRKGVIKFSVVDSEDNEIDEIESWLGKVNLLLDNKKIKKINGFYQFTRISKREHTIKICVSDLMPYRYAVHIFEDIRED